MTALKGNKGKKKLNFTRVQNRKLCVVFLVKIINGRGVAGAVLQTPFILCTCRTSICGFTSTNIGFPSPV